MSGYPAGAIAGQAFLAEDTPLLQKPFSSSALLESVCVALGRTPGS
jgi:hypothetical protein